MVRGKFLDDDASKVGAVYGYRFPTKSIRLFPVEIKRPDNKHAHDKDHDAEPSLFSMFGSTNLNEKVAIAPSLPFSFSGQLIERKNYTLFSGCSLKGRSQKRLSSLNVPSAARNLSSNSSPSATTTTTSNAKFASCNDSSENEQQHDDDCNDYPDFNSSDLVVGLQFSSGVELLDAGTRMYCHFDNNPEDRKDPSVMIALKFNDIRAVIQAHGHLDGCSQFVKVDLGIGDRAGGDALAVGREKRFSCVLTSTFPYRPTEPSQCVVSGKLCSISEWENAMTDYYYYYYYSTTTATSSSSSFTCQQGIARKSDKESGKLKFLQGHIFVSICSGDYDLNGLARRQSARLLLAADAESAVTSHTATDGKRISTFQRKLLHAKRKKEEEEEKEEKGKQDKSVVFIMSSDEKKFLCDLNCIKLKSPSLAEMIEIHGKTSGEGDAQVFSMERVTSETVTALINFLEDVPLKDYGITMISCRTAISLIEIGRQYKVSNLENYVCQLIVEEKEHLWFDIKSMLKLFQLFSGCTSVYQEKVKFKVMQAFQMKCCEDDKDRCVECLFREDPDIAVELLMAALTICSKHRF